MIRQHLALLALLLGACAGTRFTEAPDSFVGKPEAALLQAWGEPLRTEAAGVRRRLTYRLHQIGKEPGFAAVVVGPTAFSSAVGAAAPTLAEHPCEITFEVIADTIVAVHRGGNCA